MKDHLFFGNAFCAVEHSFDSEGNEVFYCLQLIKKKKELVVTNADSFFKLEDVFLHLKKINQSHLVLILNNKQVLSKEVNTIKDNATLMFKSAFPTLSLQNFYSQIEESPDTSFISIVRKNQVEELVDEYKDKSLVILDVFLGNLSSSSILSMIQSEKVFTSNSELIIDKDKIQTIETRKFNTSSYVINGLKINNAHLLSLGAIVNFYLYKNTNYKKDVVANFKDGKIFNLSYKVILGVIFLLVLINFLFFNSYNKEVNKLTSELEVKKGAKLTLKMLNENLDKKKKLLSELQNSFSYSVAKYSDQIVADIPKSIILKEINYQPLKGTLTEGKEAKFKIKVIEVKGSLHSYTEFTDWIDAIEKKKWVKKLLELTTGKDKRKNSSNFHILILIK